MIRLDFYEPHYQEIDWPSNERIIIEKDPATKEALKKFRKCCSLISVRYATTEITINQIFAKTELKAYLADIGGVISMWIGICIISFYDLFEKLADWIYWKLSASKK